MDSQLKLPSVNYNVPLTIKDLEFMHNVYTEEFLKRTLSFIGNEYSFGPLHGIVDEEDPHEIVSTETTRPLIVTKSLSDPRKVDVRNGIAFTKTGHIIFLKTPVSDMSMADYTEGAVNVVFIEYRLIPSTNTRVTRYQTATPSVTFKRPANVDIPQIVTLTQFNAASLFSSDRKNEIVVLAMIPIVDGELSVDLTSAIYGFNRPWFSLVDIQHRANKGTGSPDTPHSIGLNDLSTGDLTLYDQVLKHGIILSKDHAIAHIPGSFCEDIVPPSRVLEDTIGLITANSIYRSLNPGLQPARYIELTSFPIRVGSCYVGGSVQNAISVDHIPETNIVVLGPNEAVPAEGFRIEYSRTFALEPPVSLSNNKVEFLQPQPWELVMAGGKGHNEFPLPHVEMENSGPIPKHFKVFVDENGELFAAPQILLPATRLGTIGSAGYTVASTMRGRAKIKVGMTLATTDPAKEVQVILTGLDIYGNTLTETLIFGASWTDSSIPTKVENPAQFMMTENTFASLSSVKTVRAESGGLPIDGPNSTIIIYAEFEPITTLNFDSYCPVARLIWNGLALEKVFDIRPISLNLTLPSKITEVRHAAEAVIGTNSLMEILNPSLITNQTDILLAEDFRTPFHKDTVPITAGGTNSRGSITLNTQLIAGDNFTLRPGKIITAINTGSPNIAGGQFSLGTNFEDTKLNMKTTINSLTFASGLLATAGDISGLLDLSYLTPGEGFNNLLIKDPGVGLRADVSGFEGGYGAFEPLKLDRFVDGIKTMTYGSTPLDLIKEKYRTRSVSKNADMSNFQQVLVLVHGAKHPNGAVDGSIWIRPAFVARPTVWMQTVKATQVAIGQKVAFFYDFGEDVEKLQIMATGEFVGISVYAVRPN